METRDDVYMKGFCAKYSLFSRLYKLISFLTFHKQKLTRKVKKSYPFLVI